MQTPYYFVLFSALYMLCTIKHFVLYMIYVQSSAHQAAFKQNLIDVSNWVRRRKHGRAIPYKITLYLLF